MFKFTIRELMLLTLVVALAAGWIIDNGSKAAKIDALRTHVEGVLITSNVKGVILSDGEVIRAPGYDGPVIGGGSIPMTVTRRKN